MHAGTPFTLAADNVLHANGTNPQAMITASSPGFEMTTSSQHAIGTPLINPTLWASGSCGTAYLCG